MGAVLIGEKNKIMVEQSEQQKGHLFFAAPAQKLELTDERGQQLNVQQHVIGQQQMKTTDELQCSEQQYFSHLVKLQRSNDVMEEQHLDLTQQQEKCIAIEQMHAPSERQREQVFASEPQWLMEISDSHKDSEDIACHRRLLKTYKRRKQLSRKIPSAIVKHDYTMAGEQSEMYVGEQGLLPPTPLLLGGHQVRVDHQWLLQMHDTQTKQHRITAGKHRANLIEVQNAPENSHKSLLGCSSSEESNSDAQNPHLHAAMIDETSDEQLLEVEHNIHQPAKDNCLVDQYVEHQPQETQVTVDMEAVKNVLRVKGRIRLTHIKRLARLKYASLAEENQEKQQDHQNRRGCVKGRTRLNQLRR